MTQLIVGMTMQMPTVSAWRERLDPWVLPVGVAVVIVFAIYAFAFSG